MPEISIIAPAYNSEKYLASTIKSILHQTYNDWELIFVDDCSTDKTRQIAESFAEKDSRIKVYRNEKNYGVGETRNFAMEQAKGRYFAFIDSDDVWAKTKLEKQYRFMKENNYPISHTSYIFMDENGDPKSRGYVKADKEVDLRRYMKTTQIGFSTSMVDTKQTGIPDIPKERTLGNDAEAWIRLFKKGFKSYGINEVLCFYRVREKQISRNKLKMAKTALKRYMAQTEIPFAKRLYYWGRYAVNATAKRLRPTQKVAYDKNLLSSLKDKNR
ncbi:MAG: glycosyltransferase family 2 protein [Alphaproteobacteria bacterium]|nr:glycosyltransferase family 2 protein [Alphaproteobacteria bacterium]